MYAAKRKNCAIEGCTDRQAPRKEYCWKHLNERKETAGITKEMRPHMKSSCCGVSCTQGEDHEYGKQYCNKCKQACMWKM